MNEKSTTLGELPRWDLNNIYPGLDSAEYEQALDGVRARLDEMDDYLARCRISRRPPAPDDAPPAEVVGGYLERVCDLLRLLQTVGTYASLHASADSYDKLAKRRLSEAEMLGVRQRQQAVRFQGWLGERAEMLPAILAADERARQHAFYLKETVEQSRYLMSESEESLAAELSLSGAAAWNKLQGVVSSQVVVPFERAGRVEVLPMPALQNLSHDPDEDVRRRAYEAELAAWEKVKEPLAAAMNGVKGAAGVLNRRRGRQDALHTALDDTRIDRQTLEAMLGAMEASFPAFRRYLRDKARRLGKPALPWWDLFAPVGALAGERHFTWPEAQAFVVEQFGSFSGRLADFARRAFDRRWLDAEPRGGKRGGAFCSYLPAARESRVLCNFDGSLDQVFTVAHELGHAFHNDCQSGKTPLQKSNPMTLAETASIFCETIVTEAALAQAARPEEELSILETSLIGATQVIVDITSRFRFEQEVFERRARADLSADDFCEIMLRAQEATYGDGLDARYRHPYMWAWKPHYYYSALSFYNYPYAFGLLFGTGLYAIYQERGAAFVPDYETLLASTGEAPATDLAARFGIDLRQPDFWRASLAIIEKHIERYLAL